MEWWFPVWVIKIGRIWFFSMTTMHELPLFMAQWMTSWNLWLVVPNRSNLGLTRPKQKNFRRKWKVASKQLSTLKKSQPNTPWLLTFANELKLHFIYVRHVRTYHHIPSLHKSYRVDTWSIIPSQTSSLGFKKIKRFFQFISSLV